MALSRNDCKSMPAGHSNDLKQAQPVSNTNNADSDVVIFSLDADGCVYNIPLHYDKKRLQKERVIFHNSELFSEMARLANMNPESHVVITCGSNRQAPAIDKMLAGSRAPGHRGTGIFAETLENIISPHLAKLIQRDVELERFLVSDALNQRQEGSSFGQENPALKCTLDSGKTYLIYLQVQRAALKFPGKKISLHFYDDREDICNLIEKTFRDHPELLPNNVVLNLHVYNGKHGKCYLPIKGNGQPNPDYATTLYNFNNSHFDTSEQIYGDAVLSKISSLVELHDKGVKNILLDVQQKQMQNSATIVTPQLSSQVPNDSNSCVKDRVACRQPLVSRNSMFVQNRANESVSSLIDKHIEGAKAECKKEISEVNQCRAGRN